MSKRQDRKKAREAAHKLRKDASWDPASFKAKDPIEKLRELEAQEKSERAMEASQDCDGCAKTRAESDDDTALCEEHLAAAMGF